jgi:NAD(P)-dependent dehydrogenase (short-subunit alcohol dehydrogenase family)
VRRTIIITGASDGVGAAAARELVHRGHDVVIVGRSPGKTNAIADQLDVPRYIADYADLSQVRSLAEQLRQAYPKIDVLANNAGGIMGNRAVTIDGYEKTFQVSHLAPFLLTTVLIPSLLEGHATVIQTASSAARSYSRIDINDLQNEKAYTPQRAYGNAKLANILFTKELQHRLGDQGISAVAFHPGVVGSNFAADTTHFMRRIYHGPLTRLVTITPDKGADQLIWAAEGTPGVTFQPGEYYERRKIATKVSPEVHNPALARELWDKSAALI